MNPKIKQAVAAVTRRKAEMDAAAQEHAQAAAVADATHRRLHRASHIYYTAVRRHQDRLHTEMLSRNQLPVVGPGMFLIAARRGPTLPESWALVLETRCGMWTGIHRFQDNWTRSQSGPELVAYMRAMEPGTFIPAPDDYINLFEPDKRPEDKPL